MFDLLPRLISPVYCDAPEPWQIGFQDGASPTFEGITELHNSIFFYLVLIFVVVAWVLGSIVVNFSSAKSPIVYKYANHGRKWLMLCALFFILIGLYDLMGLYTTASNLTCSSVMFMNYKGKGHVTGVKESSVTSELETLNSHQK